MPLLTDFITGPIPRAAFGPPPARFTVEGEPLIVNAIMRELRERLAVTAEIEYQPDRTGWIGKRIEWIKQPGIS
jgi:hypothetical protein